MRSSPTQNQKLALLAGIALLGPFVLRGINESLRRVDADTTATDIAIDTAANRKAREAASKAVKQTEGDTVTVYKPHPNRGKPGQPNWIFSHTVNLDTVATTVYQAMHGRLWLLPADGPRVVTALKSVPADRASRLATIYLAKYGLSLKDDLIKNLTGTEWNSVAYLFRLV